MCPLSVGEAWLAREKPGAGDRAAGGEDPHLAGRPPKSYGGAGGGFAIFERMKEKEPGYSKKRSRESRAAIERIYITMRQLLIRGSYKPDGVSGEALKEAMHSLQPEIYGSLNDPEKVELNGLLYVAERLPRGIEECLIIKLTALEGYREAGHPPIVPLKRRRNGYRIDEDRMYVEMSRGRSDIYDILTHLTFLYIEAQKIKRHAVDAKGRETENWKKLRAVAQAEQEGKEVDQRKALVYLSNVLGRTLAETQEAVGQFAKSPGANSLYHLVYWLGQRAVEQETEGRRKELFFSAKLREVIGHHVYGEAWAQRIKRFLAERSWLERPLHIVSANLHSFVNGLYGAAALEGETFTDLTELGLATREHPAYNDTIRQYALDHGLYELSDQSGTNVNVQLIDLAELQDAERPASLRNLEMGNSLLLVMDYAFGEQAFECMDELLKPWSPDSKNQRLEVQSISVMGKAGTLVGEKGEIMLPTAHVFEGTADNYPLANDLRAEDLQAAELPIHEGTLVTVMGTSLQNRDVLNHFRTSTWNAVGIEMEGAHYQKAIQSAARIRHSIPEKVKVRYAYYASDNPLVSGSTLSSGSLGREGVLPTYAITEAILRKIGADSA